MSSCLLEQWEQRSVEQEKDHAATAQKECDLRVWIAAFKKKTWVGSTETTIDDDASHEAPEGSEPPTPPRKRTRKEEEEIAERHDEAHRKEIAEKLTILLKGLLFTNGIDQRNCVCVYPGEDKDTNCRKFIRLYEDLSRSCMFYIGICADPVRRWENDDHGHMFDSSIMYLLAYGRSMTMGDMEDVLIKHAWTHHGERCLNEQRGGCGQGKMGQHGFLYLCIKNKKTPQEDDDYEVGKVRQKFLNDKAAPSSTFVKRYSRTGARSLSVAAAHSHSGSAEQSSEEELGQEEVYEIVREERDRFTH